MGKLQGDRGGALDRYCDEICVYLTEMYRFLPTCAVEWCYNEWEYETKPGFDRAALYNPPKAVKNWKHNDIMRGGRFGLPMEEL